MCGGRPVANPGWFGVVVLLIAVALTFVAGVLLWR